MLKPSCPHGRVGSTPTTSTLICGDGGMENAVGSSPTVCKDLGVRSPLPVLLFQFARRLMAGHKILALVIGVQIPAGEQVKGVCQ